MEMVQGRAAVEGGLGEGVRSIDGYTVRLTFRDPTLFPAWFIDREPWRRFAVAEDFIRFIDDVQ